MTAIRNLILRFPLPFAVLFALSVVPVSYVISDLTALIPASDTQQLIDELVHILLSVGIALLFGYGFIFTPKGLGKAFGAGIGIFTLYVLCTLITVSAAALKPDTVWQSPTKILLGLLMMIGIGIREEVLFRGIVSGTLALKYVRSVKGVWFTLLLSGALFGGVHMFNAFTGVSVEGAIVQSLGAFGFGILLTAVYLRSGNLWFLILTHAIVDFMGFFESTFLVSDLSQTDQIEQLNPIGSLIILTSAFLLTAFLLRKDKLPSVLERWDTLRRKLSI